MFQEKRWHTNTYIKVDKQRNVKKQKIREREDDKEVGQNRNSWCI